MFALAFGMVPEKNHARVLAHIQAKGMATSVYGRSFCWMLCTMRKKASTPYRS